MTKCFYEQSSILVWRFELSSEYVGVGCKEACSSKKVGGTQQL